MAFGQPARELAAQGLHKRRQRGQKDGARRQIDDVVAAPCVEAKRDGAVPVLRGKARAPPRAGRGDGGRQQRRFVQAFLFEKILQRLDFPRGRSGGIHVLKTAAAALRKVRAGRRDALRAGGKDFHGRESPIVRGQIGGFHADAFAGQRAGDKKGFAVVMRDAVALRAQVDDKSQAAFSSVLSRN